MQTETTLIENLSSNSVTLWEVGTGDEVRRFQSQLYVGKDSVDFILSDGVMRCWGHGENGMDFYPYNLPYTIKSQCLQST